MFSNHNYDDQGHLTKVELSEQKHLILVSTYLLWCHSTNSLQAQLFIFRMFYFGHLKVRYYTDRKFKTCKCPMKNFLYFESTFYPWRHSTTAHIDVTQWRHSTTAHIDVTQWRHSKLHTLTSHDDVAWWHHSMNKIKGKNFSNNFVCLNFGILKFDR